MGVTLPIRVLTDGDSSTFGVGILPYGRFTFARAGIVDFFGEYYIGPGFIQDYAGVETGLRPGVKVNFNDRFSLIFRTTLLGYSFYDKSYISYGINGGAEIGFAVSF